MRSTTATSALLAASLILTASFAAAADDAVARIAAALAALRPPGELPSEDELRADCADDGLCAAKLVVARLGPPARLVPVVHPDSDRIRLARHAASVEDVRLLPGGVLRIALPRFGRRAEWELVRTVEGAGEGVRAYELDLRRNRGGSFDRMLRVAALFTGPRTGAVRLSSGKEERFLDIAAPSRRLARRGLRVLVSGETASSAEVLAALLRRYAGAVILGERTYGKDYLLRVLPITHDWRLLLPGEAIEIPGESLSGGLQPDGPVRAMSP